MENVIYEISTAQNDSETGTVEAAGCLVIPSFVCPSCGEDAWAAPVWYASLQPSTREAVEFMKTGIPEQASGLEEYLIIRDRLRALLKTDKQLHPGSVVGAIPISIPRKGSVSQLTARKIQNEIDFVWASLFNCVVSRKVLQILLDAGFNPPTGAVEFNVEGQKVEGYRVLEIEPRSAWHQSEKEKYGITECSVCGGVQKKSGRGTFAMKKFQASVFKNDSGIVRSIEDNTLYIEQSLYDRLAQAKLTGVSFKRAGGC